MTKSIAVLVCSAALALAGCRSARFEPITPRAAVLDGARIELEAVRAEHDDFSPARRFAPHYKLSVLLRAELVPGQTISAVHLKSAYSEPCSDEHALAGQMSAAGQRLTVRFTLMNQWLSGPTVVDVLLLPQALGRPSCVRVPLASGAKEGRLRLTSRPEWFLGARAAIELSSSPTTWSVMSLSLGSGSWVGPLRVSLWSGIGSARCQEALCGHQADRTLHGGMAWPIDLELETTLAARQTSTVSLALRPGLRVAFYDEAPGERRRSAFTPALVLKYRLRKEPPLSRYAVPERADGSALGVEPALGLWQDLDGARELGWYVGLGGTLLGGFD